MSDEAQRALLREAEAANTAEAWARAARELLRAGQRGDLCYALHRARACGADVAAIEDALEPVAVSLLACRPALRGVEVGPLAWAPDGRSIVVTLDQRLVSAVDVATGARRQLLRLPGKVQALAPDPSGQRLAIAWREGSSVRIGFADLATGSLGEPIDAGRGRVIEIGWWGESHAVCGNRGEARVFVAGEGTPAWTVRAAGIVVCGTGHVLALDREGGLSLHAPLASGPGTPVPAYAGHGGTIVRVTQAAIPGPRALGAVNRTPWGAHGAAVSPSGRWVAAVFEDHVRVKDLASGRSQDVMVLEGIGGAHGAWCPAGSRLAIASRAGLFVAAARAEGAAVTVATCRECASLPQRAAFDLARLESPPPSLGSLRRVAFVVDRPTETLTRTRALLRCLACETRYVTEHERDHPRDHLAVRRITPHEALLQLARGSWPGGESELEHLRVRRAALLAGLHPLVSGDDGWEVRQHALEAVVDGCLAGRDGAGLSALLRHPSLDVSLHAAREVVRLAAGARADRDPELASLARAALSDAAPARESRAALSAALAAADRAELVWDAALGRPRETSAHALAREALALADRLGLAGA